MDLTDRKKQILKVVVEDYIRTAEPVGSKAIAAEMGGSVSSATIRNELSDLVELGYLEQPHTSAGRVPSPKGYRLYVNELMERQRLSLAETEKINQSLQMKMEELDRVISQAGRAVSSFVNYPAYVATAGKGSITASRFDLLPVDEKSCIVVMMMGDNRVKSQLLRMQLKVDRDQMAALVELLNRHFRDLHQGDEPEADGHFAGHYPATVSAAEPDSELRCGRSGGIQPSGVHHGGYQPAFETARVPGRRQSP